MPQPITLPDPPGQSGLRPELDFVTELCHVVASNAELKPILDWIVLKATSRLSTDEGSIRLSGPDTSAPAEKTLIRRQQPGLDSGSWETPVAINVMGYLLTNGEALASPDLLEDDRFPALRRMQSRVRAVLAVPLRVGNRVTGMLAVTNRVPGRRWTADEIQDLDILATHSAGVIEQARLRVEAQRTKELEEEKRLMDRELNYARDRQMSLVPSAPLTCGPWEVHGKVVPARQVGGDYYDFFPLGEGRFGIAIADVSGKGLPAAILMANVQGLVRAFCDGERDVPEAIRQVNRGVCRSARDGQFITLFFGEVDSARSVLRYTNAGHNSPYLRRANGSLEELATGGLILGLFEDAAYERGEVAFAAGDALLLYSDGLPEAANSQDEMFGDERLRGLWRECATVPSADLIEHLLRGIGAFRGSAGQSDDMTALVVGPRER
ncbi:MAG: PP2C family protein-serine/threonine phosphatase [Candidatus Eiseniibacteriota bacterium]